MIFYIFSTPNCLYILGADIQFRSEFPVNLLLRREVMNGFSFPAHRLGNRRGYALLLGLLIVVIIGMIIYFMRMHGPVYQIGEGKSDINPPWRQWDKMKIRMENEPIGRPTPSQNQLSKTLQIIAKPKQEDQDRGEFEIFISPDGLLKGVWAGQFYINKDVDFQVMSCSFKGNIDPKEVYKANDIEDPSKLFFITKGHFMILETNSKSGQVRNLMGDAYIRGWLSSDNSVIGELIITADEKNFYLYTWQTRARQAESVFSL